MKRLLLASFAFTSLSLTYAKTSRDVGILPKATIAQIQSVHKQNAVKFRRDFEGKEYLISGKFSSISQSGDDFLLFFHSTSSNMFDAIAIYCEIKAEAADGTADLNDGDEIQVAGEVSSGNNGFSNFIKISNCDFVRKQTQVQPQPRK